MLDYVKQSDPRGCGLACVAMVAGKTYEEVREAWLKMGRDESILAPGGRGVTTKDIYDLLKGFGVKGCNCLLGTPGIVNIGDHFIVIDRDGRVLDPVRGVR